MFLCSLYCTEFWQIVLSGFGTGEQHLKLATIMFQNIFPAIDINTVSIKILLLNAGLRSDIVLLPNVTHFAGQTFFVPEDRVTQLQQGDKAN